MLASLPGPLYGSQLPHYFPNLTSFFDISDESLPDYMALLVATDPTMQAPSHSPEDCGWISTSPTQSSQSRDAGVYFHSPVLDTGHLIMTPSSNNQLKQGSESELTLDSRQSLSNAFHSDCAPVALSQFNQPSDVCWSTNSPDPRSRGEVSLTQAAHNHYQDTSSFLNLPGFFSDSEEPSPATYLIRPTCLLPHYNGADTYLVNRGHDPPYDWQRDPRAMRECLMLQAEGKLLTETFRKSAKDVVASPNARRASSARRKHAARFKCPIDGCNDDFTRKHNLDNHLRSHCGITDLICDNCHLGFTTIPVWKRHRKNCRHPSLPA